MLWIFLLVTATDIWAQSWIFVGAGVLGLVQNAYVAGAPRKLGVRLGYKGTVAEKTIVRTLVMVEENYPKLGSV